MPGHSLLKSEMNLASFGPFWFANSLTHHYELFRLLFLSVLEETSYTSKDGQFLRLNKDKEVLKADDALARKIDMAEDDMRRIGWFFSNLNGAAVDFLPGKSMISNDSQIRLQYYTFESHTATTSEIDRAGSLTMISLYKICM